MTAMKYRIDRRKALGLLGSAAAVSLVPVSGARVSAQTLDKVSYQTNWRAQAEHGGFYLAVANGIYKKYGIEGDIRMGGPQQNPSQLLLGGRVDMIMSNSFEAIHYVRGEPAVPVHRVDLPEGPAGHHLAPGRRARLLPGAQGQADPGRRRRAQQLLAVPQGEVRLHRRAGAALHLQHGAVPRRQEPLAAGLPVVGALRDHAGGGESGGAPDRRRRLRELQHDHQHLAQDGRGEDGRGAALRHRRRSKAGPNT